MKSRISATHLFLLGNALMGVGVPLAKLALVAVPLGAFLLARHLVAGLFLMSVAKARGEWRDLSWQDLRSVGGLGLLNISVANILFYSGLQLVPSTHVLLIFLTMPIMVYILSSLLLKEPLQRQATIGVAVSALGIIVLMAGQFLNEALPNSRLLGAAILLLSVTCSALAVVRAKKILSRVEPIQVAALQLIIGSLPFLLWWGYELVTFDWLSIEWQYMAAFLAMILIVTPLAYGAFYSGLKSITVNNSVGFIYFQTIVGDIVAITFFREPVTALYILSMAIVMFGVWIGRARFSRAWPERPRLSLVERLRTLGRIAYHRHGDEVHILKNDLAE